MKRISILVLMIVSAALIATSAFAGTVRYTYDDAGRLVKVEYDNGKAIEYTHDAMGNKLSETVSSGNAAPVERRFDWGDEASSE